MIFMKLYLAQSVSEEPGILEDKRIRFSNIRPPFFMNGGFCLTS